MKNQKLSGNTPDIQQAEPQILSLDSFFAQDQETVKQTASAAQASSGKQTSGKQPSDKKAVNKKQQKKQGQKSRQRPKQQKNSGNARKILMIGATLLLAAVITLVLIIKTKREGIVQKPYTLETVGHIAGERGAYAFSDLVGTRLIFGNQNGISAYDYEQKLQWNEPLEMTTPAWQKAGTFGAVCDIGGSTAAVINESGTCCRIDLAEQILNFRLNCQGSLTLICQGISGEIVKVYDRDGACLLQRSTVSASDGFPVTAVLSDDGSMLATAYADYSQSMLGSTVSFYDLTLSGGKYSDRLTASYIYPGELVDQLSWSSDGWIAVSDSTIRGFSNDRIPEMRWSIDMMNQIDQISFGVKHFAVLFGEEISHNNSPLEGKIVVYDYQGTETLQQDPLLPEYVQLIADAARDKDYPDDVLLMSDGEMYYATDMRGNLRWQHDGIGTPVSIIEGTEHQWFWCTRNEILILDEQKKGQE